MSFLSKYNHMVKVRTGDGRDVHLLNNLFSGASDIISEEAFAAFQGAEATGTMDRGRLSESAEDYLHERGLLWAEPKAEEEFIRAAARTYADRDGIAAGIGGGQYGIITSLHCNLACPYCFQRTNADICGFFTPRLVDLALKAIETSEEPVAKQLNGKRTLPKISITGGEPLLPNRHNLETLDYLIDQLVQRGWPFSITSNGTELERFAATRANPDQCRNLQVTLDGPRTVHDGRRHYRGGKPSFDKIAAGVDAALSSGWQITLRVNLDLHNVIHLPELAEFVEERGWCAYEKFSAYVSPVTDHGALNGEEDWSDEADLLETLLTVVDQAPQVRRVFSIQHFRGFNYVEHILVKRTPRFPVIWRCEAVTGMYIFDPSGDVHVCLEAVGNPAWRIGRYDPELSIDQTGFRRWSDRNVLSIDHCRDCKVRFVCAGGCTLESFHKPNEKCCMPFLREMEIAWHYFAKHSPELFP